MRRRVDVRGNEYQPLADLLRPLIGEDQRGALAINLGDVGTAIPLDAPRNREAEPLHIEAERFIDVRDVKHGAGEPIGHAVELLRFPLGGDSNTAEPGQM